MLTLILLATLTAPPQAPCLPQTVLPVVDDTPQVQPAPVVVEPVPQVVYRLGSLPSNFTPPNPAAYNPLPYYAPTYTYPVVGGYSAPAYCLPGR